MVDSLLPLIVSGAATVAAIGYSVLWLPMQMRKALRQGLMTFARVVETKDAGAEGHGEFVARCVVAVAREMGVRAGERRKMEYAAFLQDIGNVQVPHALLNKTGDLTPEELETIRSHPRIGAEIVGKVKYLRDIAPIIRYHHEAWDGSGYPNQLRGSQIPLGSRILAVCTAYSSMMRPRAYRDRLDDDIAISQIRAGSGSKYDPAVVEAFLKYLKKNSREERTSE